MNKNKQKKAYLKWIEMDGVECGEYKKRVLWTRQYASMLNVYIVSALRFIIIFSNLNRTRPLHVRTHTIES